MPRNDNPHGREPGEGDARRQARRRSNAPYGQDSVLGGSHAAKPRRVSAQEAWSAGAPEPGRNPVARRRARRTSDLRAQLPNPTYAQTRGYRPAYSAHDQRTNRYSGTSRTRQVRQGGLSFRGGSEGTTGQVSGVLGQVSAKVGRRGRRAAGPGALGSRALGSGSLGRRGSGPNMAVLGIVIVAAIAIVGILIWSHRSVAVTVNGTSGSMTVGSTISEVISEHGLEPAAGNLVSVSGTLLQEGEGYPYLLKVNGSELDGAAADAYRVADGDDISVGDGRDRTEDYDVQLVDVQPRLEMDGEASGNVTYVSQWPRAGKMERRTGRISGETADGDMTEEVRNAVVTIHQIKPTDGRKLVALTFDDGPAEKYTEAYLDILDKYGIHATFFNLGTGIEAYPDLSKKIVEQGSEVMSHGYRHEDLTKLDAAALQKQFSDAFSAIKDKTGKGTTAFRPPYGSFTERAWLSSGGKASVAVLWNADSVDWKRPGVDAIVKNSLKNVTSGSIILMHDGGGPRVQDVEALPKIIETLQGQGFEFVTVTELMRSDDSIPDDIAGGAATMPDGATWPTELASEN